MNILPNEDRALSEAHFLGARGKPCQQRREGRFSLAQIPCIGPLVPHKLLLSFLLVLPEGNKNRHKFIIQLDLASRLALLSSLIDLDSNLTSLSFSYHI